MLDAVGEIFDHRTMAGVDMRLIRDVKLIEGYFVEPAGCPLDLLEHRALVAVEGQAIILVNELAPLTDDFQPGLSPATRRWR